MLVILTLLSLAYKGDAEEKLSSASPSFFEKNEPYSCIGISDPNEDEAIAYFQAVKRALAFYAFSQNVSVSSVYELYYNDSNNEYTYNNQKSHWIAELESTISAYSYTLDKSYRTKYNETVVVLNVFTETDNDRKMKVTSSFMYYYDNLNDKDEYGEKQVMTIYSYDDVTRLEWQSIDDKNMTSKLSSIDKQLMKLKKQQYSYNDYGTVTDNMLFSENSYGLWNSFFDTFFQAVTLFESNESVVKSTSRQINQEHNETYTDKNQNIIRSVMKTDVSCRLVNFSLKNNKLYANWEILEK